MNLLQVSLENFCQFQELTLNFTPGLNFLIGRNGSGKSNSMKAVYGSLTNDFRSRNDGNTAANICQSARGKTIARVATGLTHGGMELTIFRNLYPDGKTTSLLDVVEDGKLETYRKTTEATDKIMSILGVSPKMLSDYVFVDQWAVFAFLNATDSERAKAFQRLFGTEKAEVIYQAAGKRLASLAIPVSATSFEEANRNVVRHWQLVNDLLSKLEHYKEVPDEYDPDSDPDRQLLRQYETEQRLIEEGYEYQRRAQALEVQIEELEQERSIEATDLGTIQYFLLEQREEIETARRQLDNWKTFAFVDTAARKYNEEIAAARKEVKRIGSQPKPEAEGVVHPSEWPTLHLRINDLTVERSKLTAKLEASRSTTCPTCGQPVGTPLSEEVIAEMNNRIVGIDKTTDGLKWQLATSEFHQKNLDGWHAAYEKAVNALTVAEEGLSRLPKMEQPDRDEQGLHQFLQQANEMNETVDNLMASLSAKEQKLAKLRTEREVMLAEEAKRKSATKEIVSLSPADVVAIKQRLNVKVGDCLHKRELQSGLTNAQEGLQQARKVLDDVLAIERHAGALRAWGARLEGIRNAFHRESAPKIAAQDYLELIQVEVNELLGRFDSDFRVLADEGLSFSARFVKGPKVGAIQPAGRLSGGEKVLLGIAFRVAVNAMFASEIGLLVLDEPTAGLDKGNLQCLNVAFERLRELSRSRGLQIIMITHEENLPAADNVIEIEG